MLPAINGWRTLTDEIQRALIERVRSGAGLLLVMPTEGEGPACAVDLSEISPLTETKVLRPYTDAWFDRLVTEPWQADEHPITHGIPFELIRSDLMVAVPYQAHGQVIART